MELGGNKHIRISFKESLNHSRLKQHKRWSYEECSEFLDEKKQTKLKWLKDLGKISSDNPKTVRREARDSRHFWDKKMEHVKSKIKEFEAYIQNRNIRGYFQRHK